MIIHPIVRLYATAPAAQAAFDQLERDGFWPEESITRVSPPASGAASAAGDDAVLTAIMKAFVVKADAKIYAEGVRRGGHLIIVRAPFGTGGIVTDILDAHGPIATAVPSRAEVGAGWNEATPFSSAFRLPLLLNHSSGISSFLSLPKLTPRGGTVCDALGVAELSNPHSYLSAGMGLLSQNAAPLSNLLRLPLLLTKA